APPHSREGRSMSAEGGTCEREFRVGSNLREGSSIRGCEQDHRDPGDGPGGEEDDSGPVRPGPGLGRYLGPEDARGEREGYGRGGEGDGGGDEGRAADAEGDVEAAESNPVAPDQPPGELRSGMPAAGPVEQEYEGPTHREP